LNLNLIFKLSLKKQQMQKMLLTLNQNLLYYYLKNK